MANKINYGYWRTDKEKEPGFSHEFISCDTEKLIKQTGTTIDALEGNEFEGVDTLLKAFKRNVGLIPNHKWLGTRNGDAYEWVTFTECDDIVTNLGIGLIALDLVPQIEAEGE